MRLYRVRLPFFSEPPDEVTLDPAESHHLVRVRRARSEDRIEGLDGQGRRYHLQLQNADQAQARLRVERVETVSRRYPRLTIGLAVIKPKAMEWAVQKLSELGVEKLQPLLSEHAMPPRDLDRQQRRWQAIAAESLKQCGFPWEMVVAPPLPLLEYASSKVDAHRFVASLEEGALPVHEHPSLTSVHQQESVAILIGPEGDFSPSEYTTLAEANWASIHLGPAVLRAETAAVVAAVQMQTLVQADVG